MAISNKKLDKNVSDMMYDISQDLYTQVTPMWQESSLVEYGYCTTWWLPAWWALWPLWWPLADAAMFQCVYRYLQSVVFFLVLFHCCIMLEIKLTSTANLHESTRIDDIAPIRMCISYFDINHIREWTHSYSTYFNLLVGSGMYIWGDFVERAHEI